MNNFWYKLKVKDFLIVLVIILVFVNVYVRLWLEICYDLNLVDFKIDYVFLLVNIKL